MGRAPSKLTTLHTGDPVQDRWQQHVKQTLDPVLSNPLLAAADFQWTEIAGADPSKPPTFALQYRAPAAPTSGAAAVWTTIATFDSKGTLGAIVPAASLGLQSVGRAHLTVATACVTGALTVINYDTVDEDTEGAITTGAAWKYTCKRAGLYSLTATTGLLTVVTQCIVFAAWLVNGVESKRGPRFPILAGQTVTINLSASIRLAVNDFVQVAFFHNDSVNQNTETAAQVNHFDCVRVSS